MGAARMVQRWTDAVKELLPSVHGHRINALADFSFAMCAAGHCHSGKLAASAVSDAKPASIRRRWERLIANSDLNAQQVLREFSALILSPWSGRHLLLILDETPNGEHLRCMRLGVAYRKRMLTLAAECYPTNKPPMRMPELVCRMLRQVARLLPPNVQVTLLCDRGLAWPKTLDCAAKLGMGVVMRLQGSTRVTLASGKVVKAADLVKRKGQQWSAVVPIFKKAGWRKTRLSICWDRRSKEPWILAAPENGLGGLRAAQAYAKRNWCEQSFRDEKSSGFQWDQSHVCKPKRVLTIVLVMTLAMLLSISLGTWLIKSGRRKELDPHARRRLSFFQLGLRWLRHLLNLSQDPAIPPYLPYLHPS